MGALHHQGRHELTDAPVTAAGATAGSRRTGASRVAWALAAVLWVGVWFAVMNQHDGGGSWHFFVQGVRVLTDPDGTTGGLHLYADLPILQIGPVAFLATGVITELGGSDALDVAQLLGVTAGLVVLVVARDTARVLRPDLSRAALDRRTAAAGLFFTPVWMYLAVSSTHLDDVLALLFGVLALRAALGQHPLVAGLLVGLAVDAKPWALPFGCVLLLVHRRSGQVAGIAVAAAAVAAAWLPFFVADPLTSRALHYTIRNNPLSGLRALGVADPRTPSWDRPTQALLGFALALLAVRRRRPAAILLVVVAARVLLDPGTNRYYTAGIAVGALLWDVAGSTSRFPFWTAASTLTLFGSRWMPMPPAVHGELTVAVTLACFALAVVPRRRVEVADAPRAQRKTPVWPRE